MSKTEFCRTCFDSTNLFLIFNEDSDCEKLTNDLFIVTGLKIVKDDALSQLICAECDNFIRKSLNFRKTCDETNSKLLKLLNDPDTCEIEIKVYIDDTSVKLEDGYVERECNFDEFIAKASDITFANEKKKKQTKADLNFIKTDNVGEEKTALQCQHCPKTFTNKWNHRQHEKTHNTVKAICQYCGKALKNEKALLVHYKAMHGHQKTDQCRFCDYRGSTRELVKIHERTHTGEKPYVCAECGAGFHRKSSYLTHTPLHLPEKTVQCDACPAMFKSVTLMHIHKSNAHRRRQKPVDNIWIK